MIFMLKLFLWSNFVDKEFKNFFSFIKNFPLLYNFNEILMENRNDFPLKITFRTIAKFYGFFKVFCVLIMCETQ